MSSERITQETIDYWLSRYEWCLGVAKDIEGPNKFQAPTSVRGIIKDYRTAASRWRRAATYAVSDDPISRDMAMGEAEEAAKLQGRAEAKLSEHDGDDTTPSPPNVLPIPEHLGPAAISVGIEEARKNLGPLVSRVQYGESKVVVTRNGKPVALLAQMPQESAMSTPHQEYRAARVTQWATLRKTVDEVISDYMNAGPATLTQHAWYVACWGEHGATPSPSLREDLASRMRNILDRSAIELAAETGREYDDPEVLAEIDMDTVWTLANAEHVRAWATTELTRWEAYNEANPESAVETVQFSRALAALPR